MDDTDTPRCDECSSPFYRHKSPMAGLCPECAHWLYGYANCLHDMVGGRCRRCGWDGSVSVYIANLKQDHS